MENKDNPKQLPTEPHLLIRHYHAESRLSLDLIAEKLQCKRYTVERLEKPPGKPNLIHIPEVYAKALVVVFEIKADERQHWADVMSDHLGLEAKEKVAFDKSIKKIKSLEGIEKNLKECFTRHYGNEPVNKEHLIPFQFEYNLLKVGKEVCAALTGAIKEKENPAIGELLTVAHGVINDCGISNAAIVRKITRAGHKVSITRGNVDIQEINKGENLPIGYVDAFIDYFKLREDSVKKALHDAESRYSGYRSKTQNVSRKGRPALFTKMEELLKEKKKVWGNSGQNGEDDIDLKIDSYLDERKGRNSYLNNKDKSDRER